MFEVTHTLTGLSISFSATLDNIDRADEEAKSFLHRTGIRAEAFSVRLAMREGLLNAVEHASRSCSDKKVVCRLQLENNCLIMEIEDEGEGFDWRASFNKNLPLITQRGRGLAIMRRYCTDVEFNETGNRVVLRKKIGSRKIVARQISRTGDQTFVRPGEKGLVASVAQQYRLQLQSLVEEGTRDLVIDLAGVEMIDTAGLSLLVEASDSLRKAGGKLTVMNASKDIFEFLKIMRMDHHIAIARDYDEDSG
jgi:serine/threonine-protein kinase RsbW